MNMRKKKEAHYAITKKEELREFICKLFKENNQLLTDYQYNRFIVIKTVLDKNLKSTITKEEFEKLINMQFNNESQYDSITKDIQFVKSWIIGFINGEGSFYTVKNAHRFVIEHTDIKALSLIKEHINLSVTIAKVKIRGNRKQTYCISTTSKENSNKVIQFIENNNQLQGYKLKQFNEFKNRFYKKKKKVDNFTDYDKNNCLSRMR